MSRYVLSFVAVVIFGLFMMPGSAMAHEGYNTQFGAAAQNGHVTSKDLASKSIASVVKSAAAVTSSQDDDCKGGCCKSMSMCCFSISISAYTLDAHIVRSAFYAGLPELSLPQGPPSSLLRPPLFIA